ncbi:TonB-dependent receptor [Niabella yanshanensis]|uniref:TonB-dependent receptor n=1 Tax=Niabella yanshanensis TaxID=577386 RepID=A0ABZ0W0B2_9BACT|nr:TonB-dependent receptor [Niabella yanshanensis]WQD36369.1 TonB-dependent receptor [Niabella yanshanensis]
MRKQFFLVCLLLSAFFVNAQKGIIRGTVIDDVSGESLRGVTVAITGTSLTTTTDLDGSFSITADTGKVTLELSYVSYQNLTVEDVQVSSKDVTILNNLRLSRAASQLEAVVVTARQVRTSEAAIHTAKRRSPAMMDGISADKIRLAGDATAGAAVKRVTGVSVEDGKYVYIRGLGDRYSKTTLNGMDIPGLDPDRNSLQLDIFPSGLIDNMMISKNFIAELPADFTGGAMNIEIKDFPQRKTLNASLGISVNPRMHFNPDYLKYKGGSTDFLGFDDGTRALPDAARLARIPSPTSGHAPNQVNAFLKQFDPTLAGTRSTSLFDYDFSLSAGNQFSLKGKKNPKLGYVFSVSYKNSYTYYRDLIYGEYQKYLEPSQNELRYATLQEGQLGERNSLLGLLAGVAYKTNLSKIRLTATHLQNGISKAAKFDIQNDGQAVGQSGYIAKSDNLEYSQRSLTNVLLHGDHQFKNRDWELDWRISPTYSISNDPDIRRTAFTYDPGRTWFSAGAGGNPSRIWRYLNEVNIASRVDLTKKYEFNNQAAKLKFGLGHLYKNREYEILAYNLQFFSPQDWSGISYDPNQVMNPENLYPNSPNGAYLISGNRTPNPNEYQSNAMNTAAYISNEMSVTDKLKTIVGIRAEQYTQRHTGRNNQGTISLDNEKVLNTLNFFPTVNLIYAIRSNQNLRVSYARTIARPSFKEMSFAQILDPITNRFFNGSMLPYNDPTTGEVTWNGKLVETDINNFDIRWEKFMPSAQIFSVSAFAKTFANPIEMVRIYEQQTSAEYQARNVGDGLLVGGEVEFRKTLDFIAENLRSFSINGNFTYVMSRIDMTDVEYEARERYKKDGEALKSYRPMAGQAPYVINAGIGYNNPDKGIDAGLFYNVKGPVLWIVGGSLFPDVYQKPFNSLNLTFAKTLGDHFAIDVKASNILNAKMQKVFKSYEAADQPFETYTPGTAFGLGVSYKF